MTKVNVTTPNDEVTARAAAERAKLVRDHFDFVWRLLRRLGLSEADADDAAQEVFLIGMRKWEQIVPGRERSFLYGCALNKASQLRSSQQRAERKQAEPEQADAELLGAEQPSLDEWVDNKKAAQVLDRILSCLSDEQRSVFVLIEVEQLTLSEVADLLQIARGTVASRLRLARDRVRALVDELGAGQTLSAKAKASDERGFGGDGEWVAELRGAP